MPNNAGELVARLDELRVSLVTTHERWTVARAQLDQLLPLEAAAMRFWVGARAVDADVEVVDVHLTTLETQQRGIAEVEGELRKLMGELREIACQMAEVREQLRPRTA